MTRWAVAATWGILVLLTALVRGEARAALEVGSKKQLFIDNKFIESSEGVSLTMNRPMRTGEIVLDADAPWEGNMRISGYDTVVKENGRIRLWYGINGKEHKFHQNPDFMAVAYAESSDGIHFQKPILNLVTLDGSRHNNLVLPTDPTLLSVGGGSVLRDENPHCPPEERYKSWMKIYPKPGTGIPGPSRLWVSPDGLHWQLAERLVTGLHAVDTQSAWFWDPSVRRYVGYSREWIQFPGENPLRGVSYNQSDDMATWQGMSLIIAPDEGDAAVGVRPEFDLARMTPNKKLTWVSRSGEAGAASAAPAGAAAGEPGADIVPTPGSAVDIYGAGAFIYEGADDVYISLMTMFYHWNRTAAGTTPDTSDVRLGVSRDGRHFMRPGGRRAFLDVGPAGAFDSKWLWPLLSPVRMGDELWLYYFGTNLDHSSRKDPAGKAPTGAISRAVLRLDGFVSADFDYSGGTLISPPLRFAGHQLELNFDGGAGGVVRVEILDEAGAPIPGFSLVEADQLMGNSVRLSVSWHGQTDVSRLAGKIIRLRLVGRGAKLYAFQFR